MLERTLVFVDTSYLLASFYNSWETGARSQLEIDLPEVVAVLGNMATEQLHQPIHRQLWYDGIPDSGPHRYQRALRGCDGVQLRSGQLIEWGDRRTQKGVDTLLVTDMVVSAIKEHVSDFVLVSGDADMIPGVQEAASNGVRVHLYGFGWDSMSSALRHNCDSTTILDPREDFSEAMQLQVLAGPLPPTIRERPIDDAEPLEDPGMTAVPDAAVQPAQAPKTKVRPASPADAVPKPSDPAAANKESTEKTADAPQPPTGAASPGAPPAPAAPAEKSAPQPSRPLPRPPKSTNLEDYEDYEPSELSEVESELTKDQPQPKPGERRTSAPKPSMMAPRRKLRSRYVPLPDEVWTTDGFRNPYDVGQQYATWWYDNAATTEQRDQAHLLSGGGLPPEIDRPLLQFACETLHEYTLNENQRVNLRDGFHSGIRGVLINIRRT